MISPCLLSTSKSPACTGECPTLCHPWYILTYQILFIRVVAVVVCRIPSVTLSPDETHFAGQSMDNSIVVYQCGDKVSYLVIPLLEHMDAMECNALLILFHYCDLSAFSYHSAVGQTVEKESV